MDSRMVYSVISVILILCQWNRSKMIYRKFQGISSELEIYKESHIKKLELLCKEVKHAESCLQENDN